MDTFLFILFDRTYLFSIARYTDPQMSACEDATVQPAAAPDPKKEKGVSKATAQKLLAKYKQLQVGCFVIWLLIERARSRENGE